MTTCPTHPDYQAVLPPRADCEPCRIMYAEANGLPDGKPTLEQYASEADRLEVAARERRRQEELRGLREARKDALDEVNRLRERIEELTILPPPVVSEIGPEPHGGPAEATAIWTASDWHVEEIVEPAQVNGLNAYNPEVARARAEHFWRTECRLTEIIARDIPIRNVVLHLGGDFITNDIHEQEAAESTAFRPIDAAQFAQDLIASGIRYALDRLGPERRLTVVCSSGNHARTTRKTFYATETGHSLEEYLYSNLARLFPEANWVGQGGYHSYLPIHGLVFRFHHGHRMSYWGGVGGITIPVRKAINEWNHGRRADVDVFGHFHQYLDGGNFIANGSLIGYNAFAVGIKARYEPPRQGFFVVDTKRGRTWRCPVVLE